MLSTKRPQGDIYIASKTHHWIPLIETFIRRALILGAITQTCRYALKWDFIINVSQVGPSRACENLTRKPGLSGASQASFLPLGARDSCDVKYTH